MTINRKYLLDWERNSFAHITAEQKRAILERFGTEPEPYTWSDQDIAVQIRNYLECGEFVKSMIDNSDGDQYEWTGEVPF